MKLSKLPESKGRRGEKKKKKAFIVLIDFFRLVEEQEVLIRSNPKVWYYNIFSSAKLHACVAYGKM